MSIPTKQSLSLEQLPQEEGSALPESSSQPQKEEEGGRGLASKSALGPGSQTNRMKDAVTGLTFFFFKYLNIEFLETTKIPVPSGDCLVLFMEDLRLGSHLMLFSRGDKTKTKDCQLPTVLLHAVPRGMTCRDCAAQRVANAVYSIDLFKGNVSEGSEVGKEND